MITHSPEIIFNNIDCGIIIINKEMVVSSWNEWLEIRSKVKKEDIIGKTLTSSFPDLKEKKLLRKIKTTLTLNSQTFYNVENNQNLIEIELSNITDTYYEFMQQAVTIAPYDIDKGEVCIYIYDQTALSTSLEKVREYQDVLEEKVELEVQNKLALQNIMDTSANMLLISDGVDLTFANRAFLDFLKVNDIEDFSKEYSVFTELFEKDEKYLYEGSQPEGDTFISNLLRLNTKDRVVSIVDKITDNQLVFLINITLTDKEKSLYLWNFTDITTMAMDTISLEYKVFHDPLTRVFNRLKLEEMLNRELSLYQRYEKSFCLTIIDIDHFKLFNDNYGHLIGDEVLVDFAQAINYCMRTTDVFARWGGEEFVAIFVNSNIEESIIAVEKIQKAIASIESKSYEKVTASFGLTQVQANDEIKLIMQRADEALYEAKENGRNRCEVYKG